MANSNSDEPFAVLMRESAADRAERNIGERAPVYRNYVFSITLTVGLLALVIGGGAVYWYYSSQTSDFGSVYTQLGIQPLPGNVAREPEVRTRLEQLNREPCYRDAAVGLGEALLEAGYPREAATSSRNFAKRCGNAREVLPIAYESLEQISDFRGALDVATELVAVAPENGTVRYWRAIAYEQTGDFSSALNDYMNGIQLVGDLHDVDGDVFYKLSRTYNELGRPCDAIAPIEMYLSLDPTNRRTPQITKIISDYAQSGSCDTHYASGTARMAFAGSGDVHILPIALNGIIGNFILDTGATYVALTSQFASKAKIATEAEKQVIMKTAGGQLLANIGYANSIRLGNAEALGVVVAINPHGENPFGERIDGLLGMSFLSRFNMVLSPNAIELKAIPLR